MKMLVIISKKRLKRLIILLFIVLISFTYFGVFTHWYEQDYYTTFQYPYAGDNVALLIQQLRHNQTPHIPPINYLYNNFKYSTNCSHKCGGPDGTILRLVYLIKSAPENRKRRMAIRSSWGFERRFSDVEVRTVFLLGAVPRSSEASDHLTTLESINGESRQFNDIIQANFTDTYFNNTYKTMMGFNWVVKFCSNARYYMFVDDDYYVSMKNVLRFIRFPTNYPDYLLNNHNILFNNNKRKQLNYDLEDNVRLYTGFAFKSSPHRHWSSKWYVSLNEYPYHMWPPYVSAGAYVLSREALFDLYYAAFYTKPFKFDDIYVALLALKCQIEPFHSNHFHYYKLAYADYRTDYKYMIASHGYNDPDELLRVWTEQKILGNA